MNPKIFQPSYTNKTTGERKKIQTWYVRYRDEHGNEIKTKLSRNKAIAETMARRIFTELDRRKAGLIEPWEEQRKRPLSEHLAEWQADMEARAGVTKHVANMLRLVRRLFASCNAIVPDDVTESRVKTALANLKGKEAQSTRPVLTQEHYTKLELAHVLGIKSTGLPKLLQRRGLSGIGNGKARRYSKAVAEALLNERPQTNGLSVKSINLHIVAIKACFNWMVRDRRLPNNPLSGLATGNPENDRRTEFATLSVSEIRSLISTAQLSEKRFREFSGTDRAMLYAVAVTTAFRPRELAKLTPADFTLDGPHPVARLAGTNTQNGKDAEQAITLELANSLKEYLSGRARSGTVWPGTWSNRAADLLRVDLPDAGIPFVKTGAHGRTCKVSFYSRRHSAGLLAEQGGATLREVMTLMRHSDPKLTMRTYGRLGREELFKTVENMPTILPTDGDRLSANWPQMAIMIRDN